MYKMTNLSRAQEYYDAMLPEEFDYPESRLTDDIFITYEGEEFLFIFTNGNIESIMIDDEGTEVTLSQFDHPHKDDIVEIAYQAADDKWIEIVKNGGRK